MTDNRAQQDDNGVIRQEGCATNPRTNYEECPPLFDRKDLENYGDCVNFCRDGETFWSFTDINVPYGLGGGIEVLTAQDILIADSMFRNNLAGKGTAVVWLMPIDLRSSIPRMSKPMLMELATPRLALRQLTCQVR
jgi:hypothetical protein